VCTLIVTQRTVTAKSTIKSSVKANKNIISVDLRPVDYENPPVAETALGLSFPPIKGWNIFHLGLFWARLRDRYQAVEARLPAGSVQVDDLDLKLGPDAHLESLLLRAWYVDTSKSQLLQIQSNAFIRNWRAIETEQKYIHYSDLRPLFQEDWRAYREFLAGENLPDPHVFQCEVTYINHLVKGREWNSLEEIGSLFPQAKIDVKGALLTALSFMAIVDDQQLRMDASPGLRSDGTPIIQLALNVTGKPESTSEADILRRLDACHKLLVETFADITADRLQQQVWRRIR
jgi:uncharacterized protein (TIGR04255 family)